LDANVVYAADESPKVDFPLPPRNAFTRIFVDNEGLSLPPCRRMVKRDIAASMRHKRCICCHP